MTPNDSNPLSHSDSLANPLHLAAIWITRLFDISPLGIMQVDREDKLLYINPKGLDILGLNSWNDKSLRDIFPDDTSYAVIQDKLSGQLQGFSEEYQIEITRLNDLKRISICISAMPIAPDGTQITGVVIIFHSLELKNALQSINLLIEDCDDPPGLLKGVAAQINALLCFDFLTVAVYSRDMSNSCVILEYPHNFLRASQRWFTVSASMSQWAKQTTHSRRHLLELYAATGEPSVKMLIDDGFCWIMRCPVHSEGRLIGSIALFTRRPSGFSDHDSELFAALPLSKAILAAIHMRSRKEIEFRFHLVKAISNCENEALLFDLLVDRLAAQYGWSHIALFIVDEVEQRFVLQSQRPASNSVLPNGYSQSIQQGLLGYVYHTGKDINISDLRTDPAFKDIVLHRDDTHISEMCLRIIGDGKIYALLNIEDKQMNAFSQDEEQIIREILDELGAIVDRRRKDIEVSASFERTPTAVFFVDANGIIRRLNPAAVMLLGYDSDADLIGTSISKHVCDSNVGIALLRSTDPCGEIDLLTRSGDIRQAVVGGSTIDAVINRRMITFRDTSIQKKADDLDTLAKLYADVAQQTKTPLAIVDLCLGELQRVGRLRTLDRIKTLVGYSSQLEDAVDGVVKKMSPQLHRLELTYDKLIFNSPASSAIYHRPSSLELNGFLSAVIEELPEADARRIRVQVRTKTTVLFADPYELTFVLQTLMTYLLRFATPLSTVDLLVTTTRDFLRIELIGPFFDSEVTKDWRSVAERNFVRALNDMFLGKNALRKLVSNHGGTFNNPILNNGTIAFQIDLPENSSS